jgi:hypothetical protein
MAACPARKHARASPRVLAGGALSGSAERHPIASPPPEPIGSATMSYNADLVRARAIGVIIAFRIAQRQKIISKKITEPGPKLNKT